jgi:predicted nucleotidyltransferase
MMRKELIKEEWKKTLDEFIHELKRRYGDRLDEVVVFGSYARGDVSDESDIDVLVIGDVKLDEVIDVSYPLLLKYGVYISPMVVTKKYYEFLKFENTSLIKNISREGVRVYART